MSSLLTQPLDMARLKHLEGTAGARDVQTPYYRRGQLAALRAIEECGLVAFIGEPGVGKTFSVWSLGERILAPFHYLECPPGTRGRQQTIAMLRTMGWPHDPRDTPRFLLEQLVEACSSETRVFALDEPDRWGREGVEIIRYLWSRPANTTTFVLAGWRVGDLIAANAALDSRLERRVYFGRLDREESKAALREYHPIFDVGDALLGDIFDLTHGEFRLIAQVLRLVLVQTGGEPVPITSALLERVWSATGR